MGSACLVVCTWLVIKKGGFAKKTLFQGYNLTQERKWLLLDSQIPDRLAGWPCWFSDGIYVCMHGYICISNVHY